MNFLKCFIKKIPTIRIFYISIIVSFLIWIINLCINNDMAFLFGHHCSDVLGDFIKPINHSHNFFVFEFLDKSRLWLCYSPFTYCFFRVIDIISYSINPTDASLANYFFGALYIVFSSVCFVCLNFCNLKVKSDVDKIFFSIAILCSGVYLYSVERANVILSVVILLYYFVFFYSSKNKILKELAIIGLAVATVLKVSPIIFVWLLLLKRDYKAIFRFLAYSAILFILPCLLFPRGLESIFTFMENLKLLCKFHISICMSGQGKFLINQILYCLGKPFSLANTITTLIYAVIGAFGIFTSFFYSKLWKKVLLLSLMLIVIPSVSFSYTLLYFIPVLISYFNDEKKSKWDYLYLIYFILIFNTIPISYYDINKNVALIREIAVLLIILQLFIENIFVFFQNKMQYKNYFYKKITLVKSILKNKSQNSVFCKNLFNILFCIFCSVSIFVFGYYTYLKNYTYTEYKISNLTEIHKFETSKLTLKDDFSISLECEFIPEKPLGYENVFQTADTDYGLQFVISKDMNSTLLYADRDKKITSYFDNKVEAGKKYRLKALISEKSFSVLFEEIPQTGGKNIELFSKVENNTISKDAINGIIVGSGFSQDRIFSGKISLFDLEIKNGNNSDMIVFLTLLGTFFPLIFLFYFKKISKFIKRLKNRFIIKMSIFEIKAISKISIFSYIIIFSFVLWLIFLFIGVEYQMFLCPWDWGNPCAFLFGDLIATKDFSSFLLVYEYLHEDRNFLCYSPFTYFVFNIFKIISNAINPLEIMNIKYFIASLFLMFLSSVMTFLLFYSLKNKSNIDKFLFSIAIFCSVVYLYSFERANVVFVSMLFVYYFLLFYNSENKILKESGIIGLAVASVLKFSPIIFIWLLLLNKDYKAILRFFAYFLFLYILPCLAFPRGLESITTSFDNLKSLVAAHEKVFCFGQGKFIIVDPLLNMNLEPSLCQKIVTVFYAIGCLICLSASFFYDKFWKKVLLLSLMLILIPGISNIYNLLYLIPVLVLFFNDEKSVKIDKGYLVKTFSFFMKKFLIMLILILFSLQVRTPFSLLFLIPVLFYIFKKERFSNFDSFYLIEFILIFLTVQIKYGYYNMLFFRDLALLLIFVQLLCESLFLLYENFAAYKEFFKAKKALLFIFLKNSKQKLLFCKKLKFGVFSLILSCSILGAGCYLYNSNYTYNEYKISDLKSQSRVNKFFLKENFKMDLECVFIPQKTKNKEILFQMIDNNNNNLMFEISKLMKAACLYSNLNNAKAVMWSSNIVEDKLYKAHLLITDKSISMLLEEVSPNGKKNIELISKVEKISMSKKSLKQLIVGSGFSNDRNFSGEILSFDLKIKTGNNSNSIIILTLIGFLLPLFVFAYYKKIRKLFVKNKD